MMYDCVTTTSTTSSTYQQSPNVPHQQVIYQQTNMLPPGQQEMIQYQQHNLFVNNNSNNDFDDFGSMCYQMAPPNELAVLSDQQHQNFDLQQQGVHLISQQHHHQYNQHNQPSAGTGYYQCSFSDSVSFNESYQPHQDYTNIDNLEPSLIPGPQIQQQRQLSNLTATSSDLNSKMGPPRAVMVSHVVQQQQALPPTLYAPVSNNNSSAHGQMMPTFFRNYQHNSPTGSTHTSSGSTDVGEDTDEMFGYTPAYKQRSISDVDSNRGGLKGKRQMKKRKPKRDPNEPQKPVSAYALFFRDTQATIKGKSPNASFGEVSKIVASMWDTLDVESKNMYKQKTEMAKKDYLKQLATYRANLLSKSGLQISSPSCEVCPDGNFGQSQRKLINAGLTSPVQSVPDSTTTGNSISPTACSPSSSSARLNISSDLSKKSLASLIAEPAPQQVLTATTTLTVPQAYGANRGKFNDFDSPSSNDCNSAICVRSGCPKPAVESSQWDREYCSNECVVKHCRDVFSGWVRNRQTENGSTYAPV